MKDVRYFIISLALIVGVLVFASPTLGDPPDCDKTFDPIGSSGDWEVDANWDPEGEPGATDFVCIPDDKTARIWQYDSAVANGVLIEDGSMIDLEGDGAHPASLTIHGDSWIDGRLFVYSGPTITFVGDRTVYGNGTIELNPEFNYMYPTIAGQIGPAPEYEAPKLTLEGACSTSCTEDQWDDQDDTLVLSGGAAIDIELVNNAHVVTSSTYLVAGDKDIILEITEEASGNGFWVAQKGSYSNDICILDIKDVVTGSGRFVVATDAACDIRINYGLTNLTGAFLVYQGRLVVNQNVSVLADLTFEDRGSDPKIIVAAGKVAKFNYTAP